MSKFPLMLSVAMCAIATPVFAQDATPPAAQGETSSTAATGDVETSAGDIIVTAQGRAQALADVPLAVSAVTAETLSNTGASDIRQLNQVAPSLLVSSTGSEANGSARIRGIGTVGDNPGLESSVAVFIDGVYRSRSGVALSELGEIERIEVLRGPQGTLFGRNASAGLINVISKTPSFNFGGGLEGTYGNYENMRVAGGLTGPITDQLAFRVDGVYQRRDGFYFDTANNTDVNNRDRFFGRAQLLFQPTSSVSARLIVDYTKRNEKCCAATYVDRSVNPFIGNLNDPATPLTTGLPNGNNIINVLTSLGQNPAAFNQGYSRNISVTPGRSFGGKTEDMGASFEVNFDLGGAKLTSITGYRDYFSAQGSDTDYSTVDILYREANDKSSRSFKTFSQELRLQGSLFDDKLDVLVGAYFANEDLRATDNLRFGKQYGRFATCRIISGGGLAGLYSPGSPGCVVPGVGQATLAGASGPISGADVVAGFGLLDSLNDLGTAGQDVYYQNSRNYAFFTHNIFHITDTVDLTLGARYTNELKRFSATFSNDNTVCPRLQASLLDDLSNPATTATARALAGSLIGLGCQGNSTAELNGVSIRDRRPENEITGTAVLSWKPVDDLLLYGSYSRGYKGGGFNLDRSALKSPIITFASIGGAQTRTGFLQFDQEKVNAFEIGAKYSTGPFSLNIAAFRQEFRNFQLNTFDGSVFIVQNVNGCKSSLGGGDRDLAAATGACPTGDVSYGVLSQGVELESSIAPTQYVRVALGLTYSATNFRDQLVGNSQGASLSPALRKLPGDNLSNAPELVATSSFTWTPPLGTSGLSGLFYVDGRLTSDYNTGSDLFPQKEQDGFPLVNARVGLRGPEQKYAIEFFVQNLLKQDYAQVAFNSPFQAGAGGAPFVDPQFPGGRQLISQFLAEPRTYGVTARIKF